MKYREEKKGKIEKRKGIWCCTVLWSLCGVWRVVCGEWCVVRVPPEFTPCALRSGVVEDAGTQHLLPSLSLTPSS